MYMETSSYIVNSHPISSTYPGHHHLQSGLRKLFVSDVSNDMVWVVTCGRGLRCICDSSSGIEALRLGHIPRAG